MRAASLARSRAAGIALIAVAVGLPAAGCSSSKSGASRAPAGAPAVQTMSRAERARGLEACRAYAARVCRCAKTHPDKAEACRLARSRPKALELNLHAAGAQGGLKPQDRAVAIFNARKIIQACFQAEARLDPAVCPRAAVTPTPAQRKSHPGG